LDVPELEKEGDVMEDLNKRADYDWRGIPSNSVDVRGSVDDGETKEFFLFHLQNFWRMFVDSLRSRTLKKFVDRTVIFGMCEGK
jgi:hypothetical protein